MPDPKLKIVADEIEAILTKHDVAGIIILSSQTHLEYMMHISPSWSCCQFEQHPEGKLLRIKAKLEDYPSKAARNLVIHDSVGLVVGCADACKHIASELDHVTARIAEKIEFSHITKLEDRNPPKT